VDFQQILVSRYLSRLLRRLKSLPFRPLVRRLVLLFWFDLWRNGFTRLPARTEATTGHSVQWWDTSLPNAYAADSSTWTLFPPTG